MAITIVSEHTASQSHSDIVSTGCVSRFGFPWRSGAMRGPPKILLAGLGALAMTIAPILSLDGATCGGFIYTIDKTLTTTPNACTALIENLRVDRSLLMSEGVAGLIETSTTAVVGINFAVIGMLAVHTVLVFFDKFSMVHFTPFFGP